VDYFLQNIGEMTQAENRQGRIAAIGAFEAFLQETMALAAEGKVQLGDFVEAAGTDKIPRVIEKAPAIETDGRIYKINKAVQPDFDRRLQIRNWNQLLSSRSRYFLTVSAIGSSG